MNCKRNQDPYSKINAMPQIRHLWGRLFQRVLLLWSTDEKRILGGNYMDTEKIGKFLAELRREKKLTQEQLGEIVGVTNKTVSRWENGNYLPPVEMLQALSEYYSVSINEILSGERLSSDEYVEKSEENLKSVLRKSSFTLEEKKKFFVKKWKKDHAVGLVVEMLLLILLLAVGCMWDSDLVIAVLLLAFVWCLVKYNQMMAYVEDHAFDGRGK